MGLFGKSKAEKEAEKEIERILEEQKRRDFVQQQADYNELVKVIDRIEQLDPQWVVMDLCGDYFVYKSGVTCSIKYESDEGTIINIRTGSSGSYTSNCYVQLTVIQKDTKTDSDITIYKRQFYEKDEFGTSVEAPRGRCLREKGNYLAWKYLDDYAKKILDPEYKRRHQEKQEKQARIQMAKDKFWEK